MNYVFSHHALEQMNARGISEEIVESVLIKPDQVIEQENLTIFQRLLKADNTLFLIRAFVNTNKSPKVIVTVYRTSKINKYYESKI